MEDPLLGSSIHFNSLLLDSAIVIGDGHTHSESVSQGLRHSLYTGLGAPFLYLSFFGALPLIFQWFWVPQISSSGSSTKKYSGFSITFLTILPGTGSYWCNSPEILQQSVPNSLHLVTQIPTSELYTQGDVLK